jgi:hypothetical protein
VFAEKPDLQFVSAQDFADQEIVAATVAEFDGAARQLAGLLNDNLVRRPKIAG